MQLTIQLSPNRVFTIEIDDAATVGDLKQAIQESQSNISAGRIRLIYSGKLLVDAETLAFYHLTSGQALHMIITGGTESGPPPPAQPSPAAPPPATPPFGGLDVGAFVQNPAFPQIAQELMANPQLLGSVLNSPMFASLAGGTPGQQPAGADFAGLLSTPMMQQVMGQMMQSPEMMRSIMQMMTGAASSPQPLAGAGGAAPPPGGTVDPALLRRLFNGQLPPNANAQIAANADVRAGLRELVQGIRTARANGLPLLGDLPDADRLLADAARVLGIAPAAPAPAQAPQPAPPAAGYGATAAVQMTPEQRFGTQLGQMQEMGYDDHQRNIQALVATGGDVQAAIDWLLTH
jgi:ubiquilin